MYILITGLEAKKQKLPTEIPVMKKKEKESVIKK